MSNVVWLCVVKLVVTWKLELSTEYSKMNMPETSNSTGSGKIVICSGSKSCVSKIQTVDRTNI